MIFDESYITFRNKCYRSKVGIPTGGCTSRQQADVFLHRLFKLLKPNMPLWRFISLWRRFIDDIFGLWSGSTEEFLQFVIELNLLAAPYGIKFGDYAIGTSVNFLDVTLSINEMTKLIEYSLYVKPTDSRLYLRTNSFHPRHVFGGVALSQMMRVINRNSTNQGKIRDLDQIEKDLEKSGHVPEHLAKTRAEAEKRVNSKWESSQHLSTNTKTENNMMVCVVDYFEEIDELQNVIKDLSPDIRYLTGDTTTTMVAARKRRSIGNSVLKNKQIGILKTDICKNILCDTNGSSGKKKICMTCPNLVVNKDFNLFINNKKVNILENVNCKVSNVVYLAVCKLCNQAGLEDKAYVGQTTQALHKRMNTHRSCFKESDTKRARSALALHSRKVHKDKCGMIDFLIIVLQQVEPLLLDKREQFFINRFRTNTIGLNRMMVIT